MGTCIAWTLGERFTTMETLFNEAIQFAAFLISAVYTRFQGQALI